MRKSKACVCVSYLAYNKYLRPKLKEGWSMKQLPGKSKHMVMRHTLHSSFNGAIRSRARNNFSEQIRLMTP